MALDSQSLAYVHVSLLKDAPSGNRPKWLVEPLWLNQAVGIIGGAPKSCKSWLCLDLAISVASGTDSLGRFPTRTPGPVLVYLAEDSALDVKDRINGICQSRNLNLAETSLYIVTAPSLRLDTAADQERLRIAIKALKPRLVVLDQIGRAHV